MREITVKLIIADKECEKYYKDWKAEEIVNFHLGFPESLKLQILSDTAGEKENKT